MSHGNDANQGSGSITMPTAMTAAIADAIYLLDTADVYDGAMARQTDGGLLAHRSITAVIDCMRAWTRDGSPASSVSVQWVVKDVQKITGDECSSVHAEMLAKAAIRSQVARLAQAAADRKARQSEAAAEESRQANAATPRQVSYLRQLLSREGHPDLARIDPAKMTKTAASDLIADILQGEVG